MYQVGKRDQVSATAGGLPPGPSGSRLVLGRAARMPMVPEVLRAAWPQQF